MKALIDIGHPAHVHFFRHPILLLLDRGHDVLITSRDKEMTLPLLRELGLPNFPLSRMPPSGGLFSLGKELVRRNIALLRLVRKHRPSVMAAIGGVSIAQVGKITGIPSLVFYDTENATLQNAITYPFAHRVIVPRCYESWVPAGRHIRYDGYHELSYLHPSRFSPDRKVALDNGLDAERDTFFIRLVAWRASHDIGETGWNRDLLARLVKKLSKLGRVLISSETPLEPQFSPYAYSGKPEAVHHVMAFCRAYIGESATMASECAVLGVPAVYAAATGRGYTNEQETRYGLVRNLHTVSWSTLEPLVDEVLAAPPGLWAKARERLLAETIDVAQFVAELIEDHTAPTTA